MTNPIKRKRQDGEPASKVGLNSKTRTARDRKIMLEDAEYATMEENILLLESQILKSQMDYNSIPTLRDFCGSEHPSRRRMLAVGALFRIFCRFISLGKLSLSPAHVEVQGNVDLSDSETVVIYWLRRAFDDYKEKLRNILLASSCSVDEQRSTLVLLMRLQQHQSDFLGEHFWESDNYSFESLIVTIVDPECQESIRQEFVEKYVRPYDDVRFWTLCCLRKEHLRLDTLDNIISILALLETDTGERKNMNHFFQKIRHQDVKNTAKHQKHAQQLWLNILQCPLSRTQRKNILSIMTTHVAPWFTRLELLMDFLTDSFDAGGSTSLAALAGLFHLIQKKNLDYSQFYPKLYSLLRSDILHSSHRSRFFRLLDVFLASTHLPAALVASFIKRLARLMLSAPPSAIVVVVPFTYNFLTKHPICTFMIHRKPEYSEWVEGAGMADPFNMAEPDPMKSKAVDSSLWELETLQSHYHPNVATMAKIISEQFTKQAYNLEDFLDHSYKSLLSAELSKDLKKPPVIEHEIPKKIMLENPDPAQEDSQLVRQWSFR
ncbi:MAG: hypothetical protein Q9182_007038 [Xanthomendoza sp. 2 TL-2023]